MVSKAVVLLKRLSIVFLRDNGVKVFFRDKGVIASLISNVVINVVCVLKDGSL
jgi:hypothetical protein